jgi:hypothetical protein
MGCLTEPKCVWYNDISTVQLGISALVVVALEALKMAIVIRFPIQNHAARGEKRLYFLEDKRVMECRFKFESTEEALFLV